MREQADGFRGEIKQQTDQTRGGAGGGQGRAKRVALRQAFGPPVVFIIAMIIFVAIQAIMEIVLERVKRAVEIIEARVDMCELRVEAAIELIPEGEGGLRHGKNLGGGVNSNIEARNSKQIQIH